MTARLLAAYALNLFDLGITTYWVNRFGLGVEVNPIARWLYETEQIFPVKIVVMAVLFWMFHCAARSWEKEHAGGFAWWDTASRVVLTWYVLLALHHIATSVLILIF